MSNKSYNKVCIAQQATQRFRATNLVLFRYVFSEFNPDSSALTYYYYTTPARLRASSKEKVLSLITIYTRIWHIEPPWLCHLHTLHIHFLKIIILLFLSKKRDKTVPRDSISSKRTSAQERKKEKNSRWRAITSLSFILRTCFALPNKDDDRLRAVLITY